ncbi:MAG: hypothetical protein QNJ53_17730 [Pleurocapsa sp. MO_192.B19]|nr:hypothetical protein [Pleurocapsa sp. MO_192.B19]
MSKAKHRQKADLLNLDRKLTSSLKIPKIGKNSLVLSLLDEEQKITVDQLLKKETDYYQLETLNEIFFDNLGRGIFSWTVQSQPAYVPQGNLRPTQTKAIALVNIYNPETEFCLHTKIYPDDAKLGTIKIHLKDTFTGLKSLLSG